MSPFKPTLMVKEVNQVAIDTVNQVARYKPSLYRGTNQTSPTDCYSAALVARLLK